MRDMILWWLFMGLVLGTITLLTKPQEVAEWWRTVQGQTCVCDPGAPDAGPDGGV